MGRIFYIVLILAAGCSKSPLGPEISERPDTVTTDTEAVTSGGQVDGSDTSVNTGDDTEVTTDPVGDTPPVCNETTTQNFFYPGATVAHSFTCDLTIETALNQTSNRPSYLAASGIGTTALTFSGTQTGAAGATSWTTRFNGWTDVVVNTTILGTTPTTAAEAANSLTDNVARSLTFDVALDGSYDGAGADVKVLMSDATTPATTSNGSASYAASDIPLLTYSDGSCAVSPVICPTAGTHTQTTATAGFDVLWDYGVFDHGVYDVGTRGYQALEDAKVYSAADHTLLTTSNIGTENNVVTAVAAVGKLVYKGTTDWFLYNPAVSFNDTLTTASKDVFAAIYPALNTSHVHYSGVGTADRSVDANNLSLTLFDYTDDASRVSLAANAVSMAVVGTSTNDWIYAGGSDGGSGSTNLILSYINNGGASITINPISDYSDGTFVNSMALTPAFSDGGTQRHGLAFYGNVGAGTARRIWVSKINSSPSDPSVDADYFAATGYYLNGGGNEISAKIPSFPIVPDQAADLSMVKISHGTIGGVNYFYVGWRNDSDGKLYFARVEASPAGNPDVKLTAGGEEIGNMESTGASVIGRPGYAIAGGEDSGGGAIVGVLYAQKDGSATTCNFQAMRLVGATLEQFGTPHQVGTSTDCRFPQVFYNQSSDKFMAVHVDGASGDTWYDEFQFDGTGDALVNATPADLVLTDRAAAPCQFSAGYSETWHRLGMVSLESTNCAANRADSIKYDVYKPSRR